MCTRNRKVGGSNPAWGIFLRAEFESDEIRNPIAGPFKNNIGYYFLAGPIFHWTWKLGFD